VHDDETMIRAMSGANATALSDHLIAHYLRELRVSAWIRQLPAAETAELENEVGATIAAALAAAGNREEATVNGVLDRLGPAGDIVAQHCAAAPSDVRRAINTALTPVTRVRAILRSRGWGAAEIGGLLLLIAGPFYLWWVGPIFGISLVRLAADRWAHRVTHIATVVVVALFTVQALMALAVFALVMMRGGSAADDLMEIFLVFGPGGGSGLVPPSGTAAGLSSLSPFEMMFILPAFLAGLSSGIYLALSPRYRPRAGVNRT
jgi:hypothetical protein